LRFYVTLSFQGKVSAFRASGNETLREGRIENSTTTFLSGTSVWSVLPEGTKSEALMPAIPDRPVALTAMSDAAATAAAVASYGTHLVPYATSYGMYTNSAHQNYYHPVSSSLRSTAAAAFPFAATPQAYYGNGYSTTGFDYGSYPATVQCYSGRGGYYGNTINPVSSTSSLYAMSSLPTDVGPNNQLPVFTSSKSDIKKSAKGAKKKKLVNSHGGSSSPDDRYTRVFIWEMEDVCVLSNVCLRSGDAMRGQRFANMINANIERLIASAFGIDHNDECDHVNIEDVSVDDCVVNDMMHYAQNGSESLSTTSTSNSGAMISSSNTTTNNNILSSSSTTAILLANAHSNNANTTQSLSRGGIDWMRKLAAKYQHVKETYLLYKNNYAGFIEENSISLERAELLAFKSTIDPLTQAWTDSVARCLKVIVDRSSREHYANILLTNETIICTLAKLLIMEQSAMIPAENVYNTAKTGKDSVIERILSRFGKKCSFVIISTQPDTHEIAKKVSIIIAVIIIDTAITIIMIIITTKTFFVCNANQNVNVTKDKENIPLWKLKNVHDLDLFYTALTHHLLN
uniref:Eyes absent homolog n=1 Tax=Anisakis simplex TaxID=6269 RepID=A0A158PNC6_ANISI